MCIMTQMVELRSVVWSEEGPVSRVGVEPLCRVQSNASVTSCFHWHRSFSKLQLSWHSEKSEMITWLVMNPETGLEKKKKSIESDKLITVPDCGDLVCVAPLTTSSIIKLVVASMTGCTVAFATGGQDVTGNRSVTFTAGSSVTKAGVTLGRAVTFPSGLGGYRYIVVPPHNYNVSQLLTKVTYLYNSECYKSLGHIWQ